ncbi:hypothetical protein G6F46_000813 [Rhizopus delemar]|uniref:Peptide hydrolase n=2 Tax=Rhizopus TaxID=4842 RepID=A0A9P7CTW8_9FUNG|nr:hypothetical protein G6F55_005470 [Rhizopus delemar]KAG1551713.1 hypothetical protein G6F51_001673 [Rhizopus arrhizus]KAG1504249.1 hypothetical protein G6F54_001132 [Rhizopus delemar]KAG1517523.1 hypothetical protein G6F53_001307 [Rhizopus delemar]KAG1520935.1 hypothetical protein G6F52_007199 [Rhizopus delemar]
MATEDDERTPLISPNLERSQETPHPSNSRENAVMKNWLGSVATELQQEAASRGLKVDVIANDSSRDIIPQKWFSQDEHWVIESRNVIVRLHGQSERNESLLVNAHYDSVPTSHGVTDNGMGVATAMELLRYFIHHPPRHTIIFLFNNMEEGGLIGAQSFIKHPWYSSVKLFINLEGAGAGGRAILFRCSNLNAVKKLTNSKAKLLHASPVGNDMFKAQLLKSDTDYSIFTKHGVPGLDIAFYAPRSHYHTPRDDLAHTTPEALQYMGQLALGAVRAIANSDDLIDTSSDEENFIYFDILGRMMFAYSFTTFQIINAFVLFAVPIVAIYLGRGNRTLQDIAKERSHLVIKGLLAILSALFCSILFSGIAAYLMHHANPLMTYGDVNGAALYIFSAVFLGIQISQLILPVKLKQVLATTDAIWYGLVTFWWIFVLFASYTGSKNLASLHFAVHLLFFTALASVIHTHVPRDKRFRSPLIFFTQTLIPFILLLELLLLSMDSMRHATVDGTPEIAVYILISLPILLIALHFVPWIYVAGNNSKATFGTAFALLFLFTICSALHPFNDGWSPNKLFFRQEYDAGGLLATVNLTTALGIPAVLKEALPLHEYKTAQCTHEKSLTTCSYQTDLLPKYASNATLNEFIFSGLSKNCDNDTFCQVTGSYQAKNSLMCRVLLNQPVQHAWVDDLDLKQESIRALIIYINEYGRPVNFGFEYSHDEAPPKVTLSCFYDEWTEQEIPAFTALRDNLPDSASLLIRGQGLVIVNYAHITL